MTNQETNNPIRLEMEFRRQMRSGQMSRFVGTLPVYTVEPEIPDRFVRLLEELDRACAEQDDLEELGGRRAPTRN
ncbi:hypothetical protein KEU06_16230 [Pseudaminobacter sp. 19-2017]|uniref:Anti-sigma factor NepR domain-containing protein n=2 Tax=Pseudaminobacter soli (ex Zhang et al. 2022) TaxID=2831468 RepID=A0A942I2T0_9HYPH|nr:hypothetical protein [Pseudaminobacter soli]